MSQLRDIVIGELITFVAASAPLLDDRLVWFSYVARLLEYAREADPLERERILTAFEGSGNQVMASYAALERLR